MKINNQGMASYLNGKYAPSAAADEWLLRQGDMEEFSVVIIIGISNGVHIKKIMDSVPKTVNILVYEPSYEIFQRAMEEVDLSFMFQMDIPVGVVVSGINDFEVEGYFRRFISYDNMIFLKIYLSGNYKKLFPKEVEGFLKKLNSHFKDIKVNWNTTVRYTDVTTGNTLSNLRHLYEGYSMAELFQILPDGFPVIVVSAGPSLDKNILDLKKAVGKACIIATDTAMKPLLNAGIIPDLFVIVDGLKPAELFEHKDISKTAMVTMTAVSKEPMALHKGRKFFYYGGAPFETELVRAVSAIKGRDVNLPNFPGGGSVATFAFCTGMYMGAKTIILVGQDLALAGNKVHADGAFKDEKVKIDMDSGEYLEVEAIDGGTVVTRIDFKLYLDWFEEAVKKWPHIKVVDATEGGALIHGAKNMSLKNAIKKYCVKEYNVRWHIARLPKLFQTKEEKEYALRYFEDSINRMDQVKKMAKEGVRNYDRIQKLTKTWPGSRKQLQNAYKKIKIINIFMENDEVACMVTDSLKGIEYTLRPSIYKIEKNESDEIEEIAKQGKLMLEAIRIGAEEIKQILEETLMPYVERQKEANNEE
ncbi:6-hydroxymethylpterin diphosphokinase MptE-like protein [Lachnospiraceae bacterium 29-84]